MFACVDSLKLGGDAPFISVSLELSGQGALKCTKNSCVEMNYWAAGFVRKKKHKKIKFSTFRAVIIARSSERADQMAKLKRVRIVNISLI